MHRNCHSEEEKKANTNLIEAARPLNYFKRACDILHDKDAVKTIKTLVLQAKIGQVSK